MAEQATAGPLQVVHYKWNIKNGTNWQGEIRNLNPEDKRGNPYAGAASFSAIPWIEDARLWAGARANILALIDEVERLNALVEQMENNVRPFSPGLLPYPQ